MNNNTTTMRRRAALRSFSYGSLAVALIALPLATGLSAQADDASPSDTALIESSAVTVPPVETPEILQPEAASPTEGDPGVTEGPPNQIPDANDDNYSMNQGTTLAIGAPGILANDTDPENDPLSVVEWFDYDPTELVVNADGSFTFTPAPSFVGVSTFHYKAGAGTGWSYMRTVSITVVPADVPPVAPVGTPDAYSTPMDTVLTVPANGVLANDTGALAVVDLKDQPAGLTANFDGSFDYTPPVGFVGDVGFSYRMSVGSDMLSDWIPVTITVTPLHPAPTLASTGAASAGFLAPAVVLLLLGVAGVWSSRRRQQSSF